MPKHSKSCDDHDTDSCHKQKDESITTLEHTIELYVADYYGLEVPNTRFEVTLTLIRKQINKDLAEVTLDLPAINFQTGPYAYSVYETANPYDIIIDLGNGVFLPAPTDSNFGTNSGGYIYTSGKYLPKEFRPNEMISRSYVIASNNGQNIPFNYLPYTGTNPNAPAVVGVTYTPPQVGYLLQITNAGEIIISGLGTIGNIILPGTQNVLPTTVTYLVKPKCKIQHNTVIGAGPITTANMDNSKNGTGQLGVRDSHVNDAFAGVVAYCWADNSNVADQSQPAMNVKVAIGKVVDGKIQITSSQFLTNYQPGDNFYAWDTAIAINRTNPLNIVASWLQINTLYPAVLPPNNAPGSILYAAVSNDGGLTWNSFPTQVQPTGFLPIPPTPSGPPPSTNPGGAGDNRGVLADKFGNFFYLSTNLFDSQANQVNNSIILASSDGGNTWSLLWTQPVEANLALYDFPQYTMGGDGQGNYGIQYVVDSFYANFGVTPPIFVGQPQRAFIPVTGLGQYGVPQVADLPQFANNIFTASIAASADGRVFTFGESSGLAPGLYPYPGGSRLSSRLVFKSPGPLDANYAGPFDVFISSIASETIYATTWASQPVFGVFGLTVVNVIYDDKRQALYAILGAHYPDNSENSLIYLSISRNNGQSWSSPIEISNSKKNNRGFASEALDTVTGDLLFGFYDGRDYSNQISLGYFGAVLPSKTLDKLVNSIPLSNPVYAIPPPSPAVPAAASKSVSLSGIEADVKADLSKVEAAIKADLPKVEAAIKADAPAIEAAVESVAETVIQDVVNAVLKADDDIEAKISAAKVAAANLAKVRKAQVSTGIEGHIQKIRARLSRK